jgi:NAD(P)-dependent dehydrogenase (short-subunit alcohol dehydrogenase family)
MSGKRTAIITGASGGIGAGLVDGFLKEGYSVVATSREANRKLTSSDSLVLLDGNIGNQQTAAYAVDAAINNFGTVDVLVNNAGIFLKKPFTDFTTEDFDALVSTNLLGFFYHHSAHCKRDVKTKIGMRCEHHCGACRAANCGRKWLDFHDYEGWLEFSNPESGNRVCKRRHSL